MLRHYQRPLHDHMGLSIAEVSYKTAEHRTNHWSERVPDHKLGFNSPMRESRYLRHFDVHLETVQSSSNKPKLLPSLWLCKQWRTRKNININWSRVSISILWRFFIFTFIFLVLPSAFHSPRSLLKNGDPAGASAETRELSSPEGTVGQNTRKYEMIHAQSAWRGRNRHKILFRTHDTRNTRDVNKPECRL